MAKDQELLQAVKVNDTATVRKILAKIYSAKSKKGSKSKYNLNFQDEDGFTALHHASLTGNTEIVMALLDMQCNVNARDKKGMSPLHLSAWAGKAEIAKLLIQARSCVNLCSDSGETPLHLACQHCNVGVVEVLLEANVDATVINKNGESALDLACRFGHIHVVDLLLRCKDSEKLLALYDENQRSADPPLHISCKTGREEIVIMLLEAGADINQSGANGTALHEAALYGKTDVVKILLDHGADVSITNEEGYTPLDLVEQFTSSRASADIKNLLRDASKNRKVTAKALRDYCNVYDPTCLSFKTGDVIEIIEQNESGRWKGKIFVGKKETIGYFPASMVKLANPRRQSMRSSSIMRDSAVPPIGKYEMVALASASHPLGPRPRMSSFGKSNKKARVRSPREETGEECLSPQSPSKHPEPAPIANGLQDSELFRNQQSLQYVEVSVDRSHPSPASPSHGPMSPRTQYAEVVLAPSENGVSELEEGIDAPRLPMKLKGHDSNDGESSGMGGEPGNDIWVQRGEPEGSRLHPMTEGEKGEAVVRPRLPTPIHAQNQNDVRDPTRRDSKSSRTSQQSLGEASKHFEENDEVVVEPFEVSLKPASATSSSRSPPEPFELRKALPKHESPSPPSRVPPQPETAPKPFSNITPPEVRPSLPGTPPETKTKPPLAPYPPKTSPKTTPKPHIPPAPSRPPPQLPPEASKAVPTRLAAGSGSPARIHSPELSRKGYEDMNLSPTKEEPDHSLPQRGMPPRMLDFREHLNTGLSTPERRQPLAYENVEVKASRGKTVPQSMLITEVDQGENNEEYVTVNRGVSPTPPEYGTPLKPCYENVHQEFEGSSSASDISYEPMGEDKRDYESMSEKTKNADSVQGPRTVKATNLDDVQAALDYESMGTRGPLSEYEPVSESGTVMRKVVRGSEAKGGPGKSYENVAIKSSHATEPTSPGYMNMNDPDSPLSPSNDYININVPTAGPGIQARSPSGGNPTGISMYEYNELYDWLDSCKLAIYIEHFVRAGFDMTSIAGLTPQDLTSINIHKTGHRKKLLSEAAKRKIPLDTFPQRKPADISTWLRLIGMEQYIPEFMDGGFDDMDFVQDMAIEDLDAIGITRTGHQRKIWMAVNALRDTDGSNNNGTPLSIGKTSHRTGASKISPQMTQQVEADEIYDVPPLALRASVNEPTVYRETDLDQITGAKSMTSSDTLATVTSSGSSVKVTPNVVHVGKDHETDLDNLLSHLEEEGVAIHPSHQGVVEKGSASPRDQISLAEDGIPDENLLEVSVPSPGSSTKAVSDVRCPPDGSPSSHEATAYQSEVKPNLYVVSESKKSDTGTRHFTSPATSRKERLIGSSDIVISDSQDIDHSPVITSPHAQNQPAEELEQKVLGLSLDSSPPTKRPPPPVKPKSIKKTSPKVAPKPGGSPHAPRAKASSFSGQMGPVIAREGRLSPKPDAVVAREGRVQAEPNRSKASSFSGQTEIEESQRVGTTPCATGEPTTRRFSTGSNAKPKKVPPPTPPKKRSGSWKSRDSDSDSSIDAVLDEMEKRRAGYEDRRKSFENLKRKFSEPSCTSPRNVMNGQRDSKSDDGEALDEQIKSVFRRPSMEDLLGAEDFPPPPTEEHETTDSQQDSITDEELQKELDCTENLFKDINSMLSDFSTELDFMFDTEPSPTSS